MDKLCECDNHKAIFDEMISFFLKDYGKLLKTKGTNIKTKASFIETQNNHDVLIALLMSLKPKAQECIQKLKACHIDHSKEIDDINSKVDQVDDLKEKVNRQFEKIKKSMTISTDDDDEKKEDEKEVNTNINNNNNNINSNSSQSFDDFEIIENDKQKMILIQNLLEDEEIKAKKKDDKKKIIQIKNQINDLINNIEVELNKNDDQISNIEDNVDYSCNKVEKGNDNLEKAAKDAILRRRIAYQGGLATILGLAGTVVPGIGNIIGAGLGGLIGYGVYRIDKHRLDKILKQKKEEELEKEKKKEEKRKKEEEIKMKEIVDKAEEAKAKIVDEPNEDDPNSTIICFRYPDGEKTKNRRFLKSNTIQNLYDYITSLGQEIYTENENNHFSLYQPFPPKKYDIMENTLEKEGLFPNAVIQIREE